jgi:methionine-rich copper-binding protein CopC
MRFSLPALAALSISMPALGAAAHAFLDHSDPPAGADLPASPKEIRLTFSEAIEPRFSSIELTTSDGRPVAVGGAVPAPGDNKQLMLAVPPLGPGHYRVQWRVVSVDTHRTEGDFTFTVAR